ncbi:MAG: hypothetical protein J6V42_06795 [Clostridia bacterium]|nr:hypothetical protein [Clostridia bacterium]
MSFSLLSVAIMAITAMVLYKEIKKGYRHGLSKSLINLSVLLFCAVFSSILSVWIAKLVTKIIWNLLESAESEIEILLFPGFVGMMLSIFLAILLYIPLFYMLKFGLSCFIRVVMKSKVKAVQTIKYDKAPIYPSEDSSLRIVNDKIFGAIVGALSGLIISIVVFMPLMGVLKTTYTLLDSLNKVESYYISVDSDDLKLLDKYANDASGTVLYCCGGGEIYDLTTRINSYGYKTCLNDEIVAFGESKFLKAAEDLYQVDQVTADNIWLIEDVLDKAKDQVCLRVLTVDIMKNVLSSWLDYEPFMEIERPDFGDYHEMDGVFDAVFTVCSNTTVETYDADIRTFISLVRILDESTVFDEDRDYQSLMYSLAEGKILTRLEEAIYKNPRMLLVQRAIDDFLMDMISAELKSSKYSAYKKNMFYREIASVLNDSKALGDANRERAIANGVTEAFETWGIYLPEKLGSHIGNILSSNLLDGTTVTDKTVEKFFNN